MDTGAGDLKDSLRKGEENKARKTCLRLDTTYVGTEDIEAELAGKEVYIEVVLFFLIGIGCLVLFFSRIDFIREYFKIRKLDSVLGILIILIVSPFGAHLMARILSFFWEKLRLK